MKRCPTCGTTFDDDHAFCTRDGKELVLDSSVVQPSAPPARGVSPAIVVALKGAAVVVLAVILVLVLRYQASDTSSDTPPEPQEAATGLYTLAAVIEDPDGYTNVRSAPRTSSAIVDEIREGEVFYTYQQAEEWWHVRSPRGVLGYVHSSRIRLTSATDAPREHRADILFANSPRDGFVALRSRPSVEEGERLLRIPHGAAVEVLGCDGPTDVADNRAGMWCRVRYAAREGWAFNAFLADTEAETLPEAERESEPASERETHDPQHFRLVDAYLSRQSTNNIPYLLTLYANRVRYYDEGWVNHTQLRDDKTSYFSRWPNRSNTLDSSVRAVVGSDGVTTLRFSFRFSVRGANRQRSGRAWAELDLLPTADGYLISGERGDVF